MSKTNKPGSQVFIEALEIQHEAAIKDQQTTDANIVAQQSVTSAVASPKLKLFEKQDRLELKLKANQAKVDSAEVGITALVDQKTKVDLCSRRC